MELATDCAGEEWIEQVPGVGRSSGLSSRPMLPSYSTGRVPDSLCCCGVIVAAQLESARQGCPIASWADLSRLSFSFFGDPKVVIGSAGIDLVRCAQDCQPRSCESGSSVGSMGTTDGGRDAGGGGGGSGTAIIYRRAAQEQLFPISTVD